MSAVVQPDKPEASPSLVVFVGGMGSSPPEEMVAAAHHAITLDTLEGSLKTGAFRDAVVATDSPLLVRRLGSLCPAEMDGTGPFHFGRRLWEVIGKHRIDMPFYLGGGSLPLLPPQELGKLATELSHLSSTFITNNLYSSDLVAFTPAQALERIQLPPRDNSLAQLLRQQAGLEALCLPRTAATQFDVDTPTDLAILKLHPNLGDHIRACLDSLDMDLGRFKAASRFLTDPKAEVLVAGRAGSQVWAALERDTACRVRVLSEERGMKADGREDAGKVRTILGFYLKEVGIRPFFRTLAELGDAAFIDTRVLLAHLGLNPTRADRFYSDLGQPECIQDPFLQEFTQAALEAPIPVVLGGHSLVAGGILALIDLAWQEADRGRERSRQR